MITSQEFIACWGLENLIRYEQGIVAALNISEEAKRFLTHVGLPEQCLGQRFDIPPTIFLVSPKLGFGLIPPCP